MEASELTEEQKLKHCAGCEDNFYNGNNDIGVKRCWGLDSAKLILRKKVSVDQPPPWEHEPKPFLSCYKQKRFVFFNGDRRVW